MLGYSYILLMVLQHTRIEVFTSVVMYGVVPYQGVCGEFGWGRFLVVCFLYKTNPNPRKNILLWEKVAQIATFNLVFLGLGWSLGWGVRRLRNNIFMYFFFAIQHNLVNSQTPYNTY